MRVTVSFIKADIGSIGGHTQPSHEILEILRHHVAGERRGLLIDLYVSYTGEDIAILMTHTRGTDDPAVHRLAWDAFHLGTERAKQQGSMAPGRIS